MLQPLSDQWFCFSQGRRWRCLPPGYLCEVESAGHVPSLLQSPGIAEKIRRIKAFYDGRLQWGSLDRSGTALDIMVANAMTESYGTVPSPLNVGPLQKTLDALAAKGIGLDQGLDRMLRDMAADRQTKALVRHESGYVTPLQTPHKVSVGAHHMLLATAAGLPSQQNKPRSIGKNIQDQVIQLAADSLYSAQLAVEYLNQAEGKHQGHLPLIAATYNAGRPRESASNDWHLVQYGDHIGRWISYYNASRQTAHAVLAPAHRQISQAPQRDHPPAVTQPLLSGAGPDKSNPTSLLFPPNLSLGKLIFSPTAQKRGIDNRPPPSIEHNLLRLAQTLDKVNALLSPYHMDISSAYRCPPLNQAVGGATHSMHLLGLAADFVCPDYGSPLHICRAIVASGIEFDQIIHEYGRWVHLGLAAPGHASRRQQLTISNRGTQVGLLPV